MNRNKRFIRWMAILPIVLLLVATIAILASSGLQRWSIERYVSAATGKSFTIGSEYQLSLGRSLSVSATGVRLLDGAATLFSAQRVFIEVELWSIFAGPLVVQRLRMVDARFEFAADPETGTSNWQRGGSEADFDLAGISRRFVLKDVDIDRLALRYGEGWLVQPRALVLERLAFQEYRSGYADLEFEGEWAGYPVRGTGRIVFPGGILERSAFEKGLDVVIGPYTIKTSGEVSDVLSGTAVVAFSIEGPDVGEFLDRVGVPVVTSGTVDLEGKVLTGGAGIRVEISGVLGKLGVRGWASAADLDTLADLAVELDVSGADFSALGRVAGVAGLPAMPFELAASIDTQAGTHRVLHIALRTAGAELTVAGSWNATFPLREADLTVEFQAEDLSALLPEARRDPLLQVSANLTGNLRFDDTSTEVSEITGTIGGYEIAASGIIRPPPESEIILSARVLGDGAAPAGSLAANHRLADAELKIELVFGAGLADTRLSLEASGPTLRQLGYDFAPVDEPYRILGTLVYVDDSWRVEDFRGTVGGDVMALVGMFPDDGALGGELHASGDDLGVWFDLSDTFAKPTPYELRATLDLVDGAIRVGHVRLDLQEGQLRVGGNLNDLEGSGVPIEARGDSLRKAAALMGWPAPSNLPFEVQGRLTRHDVGYRITDLDGRVGASDVAGSLSVATDRTRAGHFRVSAELRSETLDLEELFDLREFASTPADQALEASEPAARLIPEFDLPRLNTVPIDVVWKATVVHFGDQELRNVYARFQSNGSSWQFDPIILELGPGTLEATLSLEERAEGSFVELTATGRGVQIRGTDTPLININVHLSGFGTSLRELAASANGTLDWHGSEGRLYEGDGGFLFSDLAMQVIPQVVSAGERLPQFSQQCGVVALTVKAGIAEADVAALQMKTLGIISTGRVDLATEAIDFGFRTKQLGGLGLSVGAVLTPYVRVSGTLANPTWRPDKISGVVTGAAILSRGLSILAKGVWDRYLSSGDLCGAALKQAGLESSFTERATTP